MRRALVGLSLLTGPWILAQDATADSGVHAMIRPADLVWKSGPPSLPPGAKVAILEGDPAQPGPFTLRLQLPPQYKVWPHWHPVIEHVTVISGVFHMGKGPVFDATKGMALPAGSMAIMAVGTRHFAFTGGEGAVIQLHGVGPWGITYVDPANDPRTKK